jgi:hypothetical protein
MTTEIDGAVSRMPQPAQVEAMAGYGLSAEEIARVLEVDLQMLTSAFANELESGQIKANARVAESLYRKATGEGREAVTAAIFWLKTRARWKETSVHELTGRARCVSSLPRTLRTCDWADDAGWRSRTRTLS